MNCKDAFPPTCQTIQVLEPDPTLTAAVIPAPGYDPSMTESGDVPLSAGQGSVTVNFTFPKAGDYRFEYLYVDGLGRVHPGVINVIPTIQNIYGFTVSLAGIPQSTGRVLRWRVVVVTVRQVAGDFTDAPESIRARLPVDSSILDISFVNPRSGVTYGFSELRVENLDDDPATQSPILAQIVTKTPISFSVALSPTPPSPNYYLIARTP
jgi:hypothetical protein